MKLKLHEAVFISLFLSIACSPAYATSTIYSNFTGDNSWDTFPGISGGGWATAWSYKLGSSPNYTTANTSVIRTLSDGSSYTSMNGGGNYLYTTIQGTATGTGGSGIGTGVGALYRQIDTNVVDLTQSLVYQFDFRVDSFVTAINIFSARTLAADTSGANYSWCIYYGGGNWKFQNGNGSGTASAVDSGFAVSIGTTYTFTINVDPVTHTWSISVTDGSTTKGASNLGFRYNTYNSSAADGSYLEFAAVDSTTSSTSDFSAFSIDNLSITYASIPEPSIASLLVMGAGSLAAFRFRKYRL